MGETDELRRVKLALENVLEDAATAELFGAPVPESIVGYYDVITNPVDLGTLLNEVEKSIKGQDGAPRLDASSVFKSVQQMWENCLKYNNAPEDEPIVQTMHYSKAIFETQWRAQNLPIMDTPIKQAQPSPVSDENSIPSTFSQTSGMSIHSITVLVTRRP
jgi:hypothetical protein